MGEHTAKLPLEAPTVASPPTAGPFSRLPPLQPPAIPDHELVRCIGAGAYGEVWLARNVLGELRAVKVIYRARFHDARPFEREFEGIQRFEPVSRSHPSQLAILHVGKNDVVGCFYYVMELADPAQSASARINESMRAATPAANSCSLADSLIHHSYSPHTLRHDLDQQGRLPITDCVQIGLALTEALAHLHSHGLVHRDVKPSNIIFVGGRPKLADIGLVTEATAGDDARSIVGTEGYLTPEGPGTAQADIFSLGKVLYEAVTGLDRRKFPALPDDLPKLPERRPLLEFNEILLKACAHDSRQRYASAEAMRADLELLQAGRSVKRMHRFDKALALARRMTVVGAVVAGVIAGTLLFYRQFIRSHADSPKARQLYQQAKEQDLDSKAGLAHAINLLSRAVSLNPDYADAYAALANAYLQASEWYMPPKQAMPSAKREALTALRLDAKCVEAHIILGCVLYLYEWNWGGAEKELREAVRLAPESTYPHNAYATFLRAMRRLPEARREQELSFKLDSALPESHSLMAQQLYYERDFDKAIDSWTRAGEHHPDGKKRFGLPLGLALGAKRQFTQATVEMGNELSREAAPDLLTYLGFFAAQSGNEQRARELLADVQDLNKFGYVSPYNLAILYAGLGDKDHAFEFLAKACEDRPRNLIGFGWSGVKTDPYLDSLRGDPRFAEILKQIGF